LPSLLPQIFNGYPLLASSDVFELLVLSNGVAELSIQALSAPVLVCAVDPSFNLLSISSLNRLVATIGFF
jgi:hypothetical protein